MVLVRLSRRIPQWSNFLSDDNSLNSHLYSLFIARWVARSSSSSTCRCLRRTHVSQWVSESPVCARTTVKRSFDCFVWGIAKAIVKQSHSFLLFAYRRCSSSSDRIGTRPGSLFLALFPISFSRPSTLLLRLWTSLCFISWSPDAKIKYRWRRKKRGWGKSIFDVPMRERERGMPENGRVELHLSISVHTNTDVFVQSNCWSCVRPNYIKRHLLFSGLSNHWWKTNRFGYFQDKAASDNVN